MSDPWLSRPNRINPVTPANKLEDTRLAPIPPGVVMSFLPPWLVLLSKVVGSLAGAALLVVPSVVSLPAWVGLALFGVASVTGLLAGLASPSPFAGKPFLTGTALITATSVGGVAYQLSEALPEGTWKHVALLACALCFAAAGKSLPMGAANGPAVK
jgi:hypothetical protein